MSFFTTGKKTKLGLLFTLSLMVLSQGLYVTQPFLLQRLIDGMT